MTAKLRCPHCGETDRIYECLWVTVGDYFWHGPCGRDKAWRVGPYA